MNNNQPENAPNDAANDQSLNRASPRSRQNDSYQQRDCPSKVIKCSTRMQQKKFAYYWSVEDFPVHLELHQSGEFMQAPKFGDEDYEFAMKLFPNGKDEEFAGYLSLFLLIEKCPNPRLRFRVAFTLETADGPRNCHLNKNVVNINRGGIVTASKFFSLESLESAKNIYTPKDILTIGCELTIFGDIENHTSKLYRNPYNRFGKGISKYVSRESSGRSLQDLQQSENKADFDGVPLLLHDDDLADFTIISAEGREFRTHKAVLSARSEYFNALLRNKTSKEFMENRVYFDDISGDVLEVVIRHLYRSSMSGVSVKDHELSHELIMAVDRLMIVSLSVEIAQLLEENLTVENVVSRLEMATELRLQNNYEHILEFFNCHQKDCMKTQAWINMRNEKPALAIKFLEEAMQSYGEVETEGGKQGADPIIIN